MPEPIDDRSDLAALVDEPLLRGFGVLLEVAARLERLLGAAVEADHGISHVMLEVLFRLAEAPGTTLPIGRLGRELVVTSGGATRLIGRMEAQGLVRRHPSAEDGRLQLVSLSDRGAELLRDVVPTHLRNLERYLATPLGTQKLRVLVTTLDELGVSLRAELPQLR